MNERVEKIVGADLRGICPICGGEITVAEFERSEAILLTGPQRNVVAHTCHFFLAGSRALAPNYSANMHKLATAYTKQNDVAPETK